MTDILNNELNLTFRRQLIGSNYWNSNNYRTTSYSYYWNL